MSDETENLVSISKRDVRRAREDLNFSLRSRISSRRRGTDGCLSWSTIERENEGDLVIPAQMATPDVINFAATHGRGLICLALTHNAEPSRVEINVAGK